MHEQAIRELLKSDPYSSMTDAQVSVDLNATSSVVKAGPIFVTARTLYGDLGPAAAETILQKLESASASNAVVKRVNAWLLPSEAGVDVTNTSTREQLDALAAGGVLTAGEAASIKALGESVQSKGEQLGLLGAAEAITAQQVAALR